MSASVALFINLDGLVAATSSDQMAERVDDVVRAADRLGHLSVRRAFSDFDNGCICEPQQRALLRPLLVQHAIQLEQVPCEGPVGETLRARMAMDVLAIACQMPALRGFVFAGLGASDVPLLAKLRELDRRTIVVGAPDPSTQASLVRVATQFVPYAAERSAIVTDNPAMPADAQPTPRLQSPDAATLRTFIENRLKCPLPHPAARERVYSVTHDVLLHAPPESLPMRLVALSQAVTERIPGADQRTVFKQLFTLVLGGAFEVQRGDRPHAILVKAPDKPPASWDGLFAGLCLSGLRKERPDWSLDPAMLAEVFAVPPDRVGQWIEDSLRYT